MSSGVKEVISRHALHPGPEKDCRPHKPWRSKSIDNAYVGLECL